MDGTSERKHSENIDSFAKLEESNLVTIAPYVVPNSNPFVGLRSYESNESVLFFGRNDQTLELLQKLHHFRFIAVIGSSGSGKSSLVKAGLIPQLKAGYLVDEKTNWLTAIMKPGEDALLNFTQALLFMFNDENNKFTASGLKEKILERGADAITDTISYLRKSSTNFFLLVDQFEELFRFSLNKKELERKDANTNFVNILLDISQQKNINFYIAITMRSDFIGDCAQFYALPEAINKGLYLIPRLNRTQLETIVEGPVRLYNKRISTSLTDKVLNDAQMMQDTLPLLQHVLMRTWNYEMEIDKSGELDLNDYTYVGGINKALSNHADEVLREMTKEELVLTKKIFQSLTAVDANGRKIRRPAYLSELAFITGADKKALLNIVNRFIEGNKSFLITTKVEDENDLLIDISHESLIRQWALLNEWVDTETDSAKIFLRLIESEKLYKAGNKNLLAGNELGQFWQWYFSFNPGPAWAKRYSESYNDCIDYLKQSETSERKYKAARLRNRRLLIAAVALVFIVITLFSVKVHHDYIESTNQLALNYWTASQAAADKDNYLDALHLIAESAETSTKNDFIKNLFISSENLLPAACLKNMFQASDIINSTVFSADGKWILTACNDGSVFIIDKTTGAKIKDFMSDGLPVVDAVFSPDQKLIATTGINNTARLWNVATASVIKIFKHNEALISVCFSYDGQYLITGCADNYARIWNINSGNIIDSLKQHAAVTGAVFNRNKTKVLTCGNDSTAYLWNVSTGKPIYAFHHNDSIVTTAVFSADERMILTTGNDSIARTWDAETGMLTDSVKFKSQITCGAFSPDGKLIAVGTRGNHVHLYSLVTHTFIGLPLKHSKSVYSVDFCKDGKWLITGGGDKIIRLWNIETGTTNENSSFKTNGIVSNAIFSKDGKWIITCGYDSVARIWDTGNGRLIDSFNHGAVINNIAFNKDEKLLVTCGFDSTIKLWNINTGKLEYSLKYNSLMRSAVFSRDSKTLLIAGDDSTIRFLTIATKQEKTFHFKDRIRSAVLSPDNKTILVTASADTAYLLNAENGEKINAYMHNESIRSAVFSADGKWVLTAGWDSTARMWDATTGQQIGAALRHNNNLSGAAFSADGKWIVTSGYDLTVRIWDVNSKKQIISFPVTALANTAVFSADEKSILIASRDSNAYLLKIPGDLDISPSLFKLQAQVITGVQYNPKTNETECILPTQWNSLHKKYITEATQHYKNCNYPAYNVWHRFNPDQAK